MDHKSFINFLQREKKRAHRPRPQRAANSSQWRLSSLRTIPLLYRSREIREQDQARAYRVSPWPDFLWATLGKRIAKRSPSNRSKAERSRSRDKTRNTSAPLRRVNRVSRVTTLRRLINEIAGPVKHLINNLSRNVNSFTQAYINFVHL